MMKSKNLPSKKDKGSEMKSAFDFFTHFNVASTKIFSLAFTIQESFNVRPIDSG